MPERLQDRSLPAPGLLAHMLVAKYCDHLPLYRQEQIFARRHDVHLPRQTLARWVALAADWLKPIYEHIRTGVMAGGYVQVDETPVNYLEPGYGRTQQGYFWTASRPGGDVFFRWETSRAAACLDNVIPPTFAARCNATATRPTAPLPTVARARSPWPVVGRTCAGTFTRHAKRHRRSGWLLRHIQHLYRIEAILREHRAGPRLRQAVRASQSRPIVERIESAFLRLKASGRYLPQSLLGQAIDYALGQWPTLKVYLRDGRIEIDNNGVENAIRPTAIGKKNWLFVGEAGAGQHSAVVYTVIESCRRRGLDPYAYLREVLTRLPQMTNRQIPEVIPQRWGKTHRPLQLQAAS